MGRLGEDEPKGFTALALAPSGKFLAAATDAGGEVQIWDIASGTKGYDKVPIAVGRAHCGPVSSVRRT